MLALILQFYLPALLITILLAVLVSLIYLLIILRRSSNAQEGETQTALHELFILNLLIIPIASFSLLAVFIVIRSLSI